MKNNRGDSVAPAGYRRTMIKEPFIDSQYLDQLDSCESSGIAHVGLKVSLEHIRLVARRCRSGMGEHSCNFRNSSWRLNMIASVEKFASIFKALLLFGKSLTLHNLNE